MFIEAFLFGVTIAIAVGPIALLIVNASINRGLKAGLACGAGAAFADFTFALGAFLAGSAALRLIDTNRHGIAVFAALLLCGLGVWMLACAWRDRGRAHAAALSGPGFVSTWLLTLANPLTLLFFAAWLGSRRDTIPTGDAVQLAGAVAGGSLLVQSALALAGRALRPLLSRPAALFAANVAGGAGVFAFGIHRLLAS